ncbi:MAG: histidyl-tRNA synthetase [Mycoplasmataceae bacterium RC_NB112A]|nr:MAG: histidyl-tRNA synthetase [Mycoplasmataceae bacterium RC_NB112A]
MTLPNKPRGAQDIYPPRSLLFQKIQQIITEILRKNNYQPLIFPTFETQELFTLSLGAATDIIHKEMYTFSDRKGRQLALRPEGTASVARLVCQNNLIKANYPLKFYYWANMFRYERPQAGRHREFWQLGVELINILGTQADFQILKLASDILTGLGITGFIFNINYLGGKETKENYKKELTEFINKNNPQLCSDCQRRYQVNPLRILDCSICQKISFPAYEKVWNVQSRSYFQALTNLLNRFNFPYQHNSRLIRGLDYYTGIVFEVNLETKKAILGGGRYDNLYQEIAGCQVSALGFAFGIERLINYLENYQVNSPLLKIIPKVDIFFLTSVAEFYPDILTWKKELHKYPWTVDYNLEIKNFNKFRKVIRRYQPYLLIILGIKEWKSSKIVIKDCQKQEEFQVEKNKVVDWIINYLKELSFGKKKIMF